MNTEISSEEMEARQEYVESQQAVVRKARELLESSDVSPLNRELLRLVVTGAEERIALVTGYINGEDERLNADAPRVAPLEPDDFEARIKRLNGETNGD